jgi:hypothetical protein
MRAYGQTKLGFYPLPLVEADRLKNWLCFSEQFSVLDPCVGDGAAFTYLLHGVDRRLSSCSDSDRYRCRVRGGEPGPTSLSNRRCSA